MRSRSQIGVAIALGLVASTATAATPKPARWVLPDTPAHCAITITLKKRIGGTETLAFRSALKNERQCRRLAQLHEPNFNPDTDAAKRVAFRWTGPRDSRKKGGHGGKAVARRQGRRRGDR